MADLTTPRPDWPCEAYGEQGLDLGVLCFVADPGDRSCHSRAACSLVMAAERRRVYVRLQDMAGQTEDRYSAEIAAYILAGIDGPGDILGGRDGE
jgi:hypothetical protein